ncbi:HD domain-containing protein [Adhaeribacter soli]|uniref:Metal-dependent HD superfamily phosphohydrolase n=1 Tax=Adhaeribacter soli TaxID=2607655 RepID=A0A5N1IND0_9BACT|nr:hypothetical protein [Adhaeribacter soli]KAA9325417.1 hypothetical protein F0P94_17675 [Adhaeribacter soli]
MPNASLNPEKVWRELAGNYTSDQELIETLWQELQQNYSEQNRHYHNLNHLSFMLEQAKRYEKQLKNPDAVTFAIFFHDIVYNSSQTDNEERSAALAEKRLLELTVPEATIMLVKEAILATKTHALHLNSDINFLLDFDLAILGTDWETYQAYAKSIREEYAHVPEEAYKAGRKKVLQHFLAMPRIFKTPIFQTLLEARAHHNLQAELQIL